MGGLQAQSTALATGSSGTGTGFVALEDGHPAAGGAPVESHLDSFFNQSGWTREDVELVLRIASTAILLYLFVQEVN